MKILILLASLSLLLGCSDDKGRSNGQLSQSDCESVGGTMVEGQCRQEVDPEQMKSICASQGMKYIEKFNGCIEE